MQYCLSMIKILLNFRERQGFQACMVCLVCQESLEFQVPKVYQGTMCLDFQAPRETLVFLVSMACLVNLAEEVSVANVCKITYQLVP